MDQNIHIDKTCNFVNVISTVFDVIGNFFLRIGINKRLF